MDVHVTCLECRVEQIHKLSDTGEHQKQTIDGCDSSGLEEWIQSHCTMGSSNPSSTSYPQCSHSMCQRGEEIGFCSSSTNRSASMSLINNNDQIVKEVKNNFDSSFLFMEFRTHQVLIITDNWVILIKLACAFRTFRIKILCFLSDMGILKAQMLSYFFLRMVNGEFNPNPWDSD